MKEQLQKIQQEFLETLREVSDLARLEELRIEYLGRKGRIADVMRELSSLAEDARKEIGAAANDVKTAIETAFVDAQNLITQKERASGVAREWIDITAPGADLAIGHTHPVAQAIQEITEIFSSLGFVRVRHPEVEWDWYAFESLNMPGDHPARDDWETFFVDDGGKKMQGAKGRVVLTPHTSNGQVREMEKKDLPIRMLNIAKCYRRQSDVSHAPMFHQFEGLLIDKHATVAQLKGTLDFFVKRWFGPDRTVRLRPHHFRFTEPSFEIDVSAEAGKEGLKLYKEGWLEIGGSGMVHPNVLKAGGIDPNEYSGFAFGFGVERCMMLKAGINIDDIRILYKNDLRFLRQF